MFLYEKKKPLLIIGFGNPLLSDDGAGIETIKKLHKLNLPKNITLLDGGNRGIDLIFLAEKYQQIIIIDAVITTKEKCKINNKPNKQYNILEFNIDNIITKNNTKLSLHNFNIASTIKLMTALDIKIPRLIFLGIKAVNINYGMSLTNNVKRDIDLVIDRIKQIINT